MTQKHKGGKGGRAKNLRRRRVGSPENLFSHRAGRSEPTQKQKMPASNPGTRSVPKEIRARSAGAPSENPERAAEYAARGPNMRG